MGVRAAAQWPGSTPTKLIRLAMCSGAGPSVSSAGDPALGPDTMALLTGYLPVEQGVACWAALGNEADALGRR